VVYATLNGNIASEFSDPNQPKSAHIYVFDSSLYLWNTWN